MGTLFNFEAYEIALAVLGAIMLLAAWLPQYFLHRHVTLPFLHLASGYLLFTFANIDVVNPLEEENRWLWEKLTEMAVIISLLGAGLKIEKEVNWRNWKPTFFLLAVTMPLTIVGVSLFGYWVCGLSVASAALLGAICAPTDPVLAADVQVSPPHEEHPHDNHVRFPLTSEAGLNDGLAFPFTYFAIGVALYGFGGEAWLGEWLWKAVIYKIAVGTFSGWALGYLLAKMIFKYPTEKPLAKEGLGCIALCILFIAYGGTELIGGYGFLAVFVAALRIKKSVDKHEYHLTLYEFSENLEHTGMSLILFMLGGLSTMLLPALDIYGVLFGLTLIFVIRPAAGWIGMSRLDKRRYEKIVVAFYGIRGIGSIYYLAYAMGKADFEQMPWIWATVIFTIALSSAVHGFTAIPVMRWLDSQRINDPERSNEF